MIIPTEIKFESLSIGQPFSSFEGYVYFKVSYNTAISRYAEVIELYPYEIVIASHPLIGKEYIYQNAPCRVIGYLHFNPNNIIINSDGKTINCYSDEISDVDITPGCISFAQLKIGQRFNFLGSPGRVYTKMYCPDNNSFMFADGHDVYVSTDGSKLVEPV